MRGRRARPRAARRAALAASMRWSTRRRRSASASPCTRSSTTSTSTSAARPPCSTACRTGPARLRKLLVFTSMTGYGEGRLPPAVRRPAAPRRRPHRGGHRPARLGAGLPRDRRGARAGAHARGLRAARAQRLCAHQALAGGARPEPRRRLRLSGRLPAPVQRVRAAAVAQQSVHRRPRDLPLPPARRRAPGGLRGRRAEPRLHLGPRRRRHRRSACSRPASADGGCSTSAAASPGASRDIGRTLATLTGREDLAAARDRPVPPRRRPPLHRRRRRAPAAVSASRRASPGRTGCGSCSAGAADAASADHFAQAQGELERRGLLSGRLEPAPGGRSRRA